MAYCDSLIKNQSIYIFCACKHCLYCKHHSRKLTAEADDGVGHAHRHKGDEQVRVLAQDLGQAQIRDLGHGVGQERLHDQREQFGRKAGNGKDEGVAGQFGRST